MIKSIRTYIIYFFIRKPVFRLLPDKLIIILDFYMSRKKILKLKHPKTFSEKIQWIKIYGGLEQYSKYADKYEVRDFISKTIGDKYLIPLLGAWDNFEDILFSDLPQKFVIKATHGSKYNYICQDKSSLDITVLRKTITKWMHENYYFRNRESQYKLCKPKIICEKYLEDESGGLTDYKFFCFNGNPEMIQLDFDRFSEHKRDLMDLNWNKLPITLDFPNSRYIINKPRKFKEMLDIAKKLAKFFPFVRVDLYYVKNKIYFGELTFTPGNGIEEFNPAKIDYQLGELIDLSKYNKNKVKK